MSFNDEERVYHEVTEGEIGKLSRQYGWRVFKNAYGVYFIFDPAGYYVGYRWLKANTLDFLKYLQLEAYPAEFQGFCEHLGQPTRYTVVNPKDAGDVRFSLSLSNIPR